MPKWLKFGSSKTQKSTKELYAELEKLEQQEKDAQERALIQAKIAELKHNKRSAILSKLRGAGESGYKMATSEKSKRLLKKVWRDL